MVNSITSQPLIRDGIEIYRQALEWWLSELRGLIQLAVSFGGDGVIEFEVSATGEAEPVAEATAHKAGQRRSVRLKLDQGAFLYRKIKLPAAARKSVERVVGFEFNKYFPMDVADAFFSCQVLPAPTAAASIEIEIWAINRALVERYQAQIRVEHGLEIRQLELANRDGRVLITRDIDKQRRLAARADKRGLSRALNLLIAGLLTVLLVYPVARMDTYLEQQRQEITRLEKLARPAIETRDKIFAIETRFDSLAERKRSAPTQAELWSHLTQALSPRTTLDSLQIDGRGVQIMGNIESVEDLLRSLEKDPRIGEVKIIGPVKSSNDSALESLRLSLTVRE